MGRRRAAVYARISQDREGAGLGVARQEEDCRALCERRGWDVVEVYADNDVSAYSGKPRPAWRRMLADIEAGTITAVAVWHVDRLTRSPAELEHVITLADRHGLELATVTGEVDLATPTGRMIARIVGATVRGEVEHKAERQQRQRRQAAESGRPNGGGTRPYGFASDLVSLDEPEAAIVREAAARALAGESLSSICRDLASRGVTTPQGGSWRPTTLRRMLASARISGRREHRPRRSGDSGTRPLLGEIVADAAWPPIISAADSDRLRALLNDPARQRFSPATGRSYLLSGILRCGKCGTGMVGRPRSDVPRYVCPNTPGGPGCGGTATNTQRTDELVRDLVLIALASPELAERLREPDTDTGDVTAALRDDERRLDELAVTWASGEITRGEWTKARDVIAGRIAEGRRRLALASVSSPLAGLDGTYDDLLLAWTGMNQSQRRAVVSAVLEAVEVAPADPRRRWDPDRFHPKWRA